MRRLFVSFFTGVLLLFVLAGACADVVSVAQPVIHPDTPENRNIAEGILERAAILAGREYGDYFEVVYGSTAGDFAIQPLIVFNDSEPTGTLTISKKGASEEYTSYILGDFTEDKIGYYAASYASLWNSFTNGFAADLREPPAYVDELYTDIVAPVLLPEYPGSAASLILMSGATLRDGSLILGLNSVAGKFDPWLRFTGRPGSELIVSSGFNLAGKVFTTPSDSIVLVPITGRDYYRVVDGVSGSVRQQVGADVLATNMVVLNDGSVVQKGMADSQVTRYVGRKRTTFSLATSPSSYINLIAAGPDGNLWCWDMTESRIKVFSPEGILVDSIVPIRSNDVFLAPQALVPYPDGGFLLLAPGATGMAFQKFKRNGRPEWVLDSIDNIYGETLPYGVIPVVGRGGADLFLLDSSQKRVIKLYDSAYEDPVVSQNAEDSVIDRVLAMNREILENPDSIEGYEKKAGFYESIGATELAQAAWREILNIDPYYSKAQTAQTRFELDNLRTIARIQDLQTRELLDTRGPESARFNYSTALKTYEQIIAMDPNDTDTADAKRRLEEDFFRYEATPGERRKPVTVASVSIEDIFPSLANYYRSTPAGTVTIRNTLEEPIFDVVARTTIPKYMDFPNEGTKVETLGAGESVDLDIRIALNSEVFYLEEDLRLPVKVEIVYFTGAGGNRSEQVVTEYPGVTMHRKTALSWDDSGKIASFIVTRENVVQSFAIGVTRSVDLEVPGIPDRVVRAAALCDAVGIHAIEYIEDPDSPFSDVFGKQEIIDTVRFPRDTLQYRIGDCDDTTALLASLLEAVGVRTAIMTSPGHVFMAFNTNEPDSNAWLFQTDELTTISADGDTWIPIETTTLSDGFYAAWKNASRLVLNHPDEVEFLPTADEQLKYPPMPLPSATFTIVEPPPASIIASLEHSLSLTSDALYQSAVSRYEQRLASVSGSRAVKYRNQIGVLQARFGRYDEAKATLRGLLDENPDYSAGYVNLANVHMLENDAEGALDVLRLGVERTNGSPILSISVAQTLYHLGRKADAAEVYAGVAESSPDLAGRFSYLAGDDTTARAGTEPDAPLLWDEGVE